MLRLTQLPTDHTAAARLLNGSGTRPIAHNTWLSQRADGIALGYHGTAILTYRPDGTIVLHPRGWYTRTTMRRLNTALRGRGRLFSRDFDPYYAPRDGAAVPFPGALTIAADGAILS